VKGKREITIAKTDFYLEKPENRKKLQGKEMMH